MRDERAVGFTKLVCARQLDLHHSELLLGGRLAGVNVKVHLVDVDNDELSEPIAAAHSSKLVRPVGGIRDLVRAHRLDINHVQTCGNLVDQNERPNSPQRLLQLGFQNDQVVSAHRGQLYKVSVLGEVFGVLLIVRH